jgi:hypothetical protein
VTQRALQAGAAFVSGVFITALVLHLVGNDLAERVATLGVIALIATPAVALAATAFDNWGKDRVTALLALTVLAVLAVAVAVAFATR